MCVFVQENENVRVDDPVSDDEPDLYKPYTENELVDLARTAVDGLRDLEPNMQQSMLYIHAGLYTPHDPQ